MSKENLPLHLQKYVVDQNYEKYTPVDQAVWRYILRQLKSFLSIHAHECYVDGLEKTGINVEEIPKIEDISKKISKFGWKAIPVSGFIPPAAFMELQSLGYLPIASDIRSLEHLMYTPAPDIVHEAAGHAPILVDKEFANYLKQYAQVAKKAIISSEDLALYEAIRILSDVKENPTSTKSEIDQAQAQLEKVSKNMTHVSEAAELARMNWWTAEYGLIGDLSNPKLFGAGLLSSVGEAKWCLSEKVKKIPLTVDCIKTSYDITEPQPQLFVTPNFNHLTKVLNEFANLMAFKMGGLSGINKAIQAKSVNTAELDSGIQIVGIFSEVIADQSKNIIYLKTKGPTQLCYKDKELEGHSKKYHAEGFGTPLGKFKMTGQVGIKSKLEFASGVVVDGFLKSELVKEGHVILMTFTDCKVTLKDQVLFDPSWGTFDMAVGQSVKSVFGGASDRLSYGEGEDFVAARVPKPIYSDEEKQRHQLYSEMRNLRNSSIKDDDLESKISKILDKKSQDDWLLLLEAYELVTNRKPDSKLKNSLFKELGSIKTQHPEKESVINDGLALARQL